MLVLERSLLTLVLHSVCPPPISANIQQLCQTAEPLGLGDAARCTELSDWLAAEKKTKEEWQETGS